MATKARRLTLLGELVAATFDEAAKHTTDQQLASRVATEVVLTMLRKSRRHTSPLEKARPSGVAASMSWLS